MLDSGPSRVCWYEHRLINDAGFLKGGWDADKVQARRVGVCVCVCVCSTRERPTAARCQVYDVGFDAGYTMVSKDGRTQRGGGVQQ